MLGPIVHRANLDGMDILAQVLDRVRLGGTLLFHFELGHPMRNSAKRCWRWWNRRLA